MSHHPRAILFDFDGTLADTSELVMESFRHTMTHHLPECPSDASWLEGFGRTLEAQIARYARSPQEHASMVRMYTAFQEERMAGAIRPFAGAVEAVAELDRRGVKLAIVTSRVRHSTLQALDLCGLMDHFPVVVTPEDVTHPKPHPEPVRLALGRLGVRAAEAWFVGDSPHDVAAGRAAGTRTAAAAWGPFPRATLQATGADVLLERLDELLQLGA